jgi:hypothetical protein
MVSSSGLNGTRERRRVLSVGSAYLLARASEYMVASTSKYSSAELSLLIESVTGHEPIVQSGQ